MRLMISLSLICAVAIFLLTQLLASAVAIAFSQIVTAGGIGIVVLFALIVFTLIRRGSRDERS